MLSVIFTNNVWNCPALNTKSKLLMPVPSCARYSFLIVTVSPPVTVYSIPSCSSVPPLLILVSVLPLSVKLTVTSACADIFLSKLAVVWLSTLFCGVLSLTVTASVCGCPPLNTKSRLVTPVLCNAKYSFLIVTVVPVTT
ncbi:hypothetical protein D3C77_393810 [compost metagenome]